MNTANAQTRAERVRLEHRAMCEEFARKMATRLDEHAHVGRFSEWKPTPPELRAEIETRLNQLRHEPRGVEAARTCVDIANMLMRYSQLAESR